MSREGNQAVTMLAIIVGAMETLKVEDTFAKIEIKEAIENTSQAAKLAIDKWPTWKNWKWCKARFHEFRDSISDSRPEYKAIEMVRIAERLAIDLAGIHKPGGTKGDLIAPILPGLKTMVEYLDRDGKNFRVMETAGESMDNLYNILEFDDTQLSGIQLLNY